MDEGEALAYLYSFIDYEDPAQRRRGPGFTLDGMRCLLRLLEHPERRYPSVVIAGSKGKGSTSAMVAGMLQAAGYRTGLYTQPHLHAWNERVRVDGRPLPPAALVAAVERLQAIVPRLPEVCPAMTQPTFYELGTAVALLHFATLPVDVAVLEIGLGGRLDAVNTVTPLVSAITPISLEHTAVLGTTLAAIAGEKAGIIKPGVPVVVAPQPAEAAAVIERVAAEQGAPLIRAAERATVRAAGNPAGALALAGEQALSVTLPASLTPGSPPRTVELTLPLLGAHQHENAATALAIAEALTGAGTAIPADAAVQGLTGVRWPGRLEVLQRAPLVIVDVAHNPASAARLRQALATHFPDRQLTLILAVLNDKDIAGIAAELVPAARRVLATTTGEPRSAPVETIVAAVARAGGRAEAAPSVAAALDRALAMVGEQDIICVTGSLVTGAAARSYFGRQEA